MFASGLNALDVALETPKGGPYRQVFNFSLATGGRADGVTIHSLGTRLAVEFAVLEFDAGAGDGPVSVRDLSVKDGALVVTLDLPQSIRRIRLGTLALSDLGFATAAIAAGVTHFDWGTVALHNSLSAAAVGAEPGIRMERSELAAKARKDYAGGAIWRVPVTTLELYRIDGEAIAAQPTLIFANDSVVPAPFVAERFAVRGLDISDVPLDLEPGQLSLLRVEGVPSAPRVGLGLAAMVADGKPGSEPNGVSGEPASGNSRDLEFFLSLPGEVRNPGDWTAINADAGAKLAAVLERQLQGLIKGLLNAAGDGSAPLPDPVSFSLVVESDAPCRFHLMDFAVSYSLIRERSSLRDADGRPLPKAVFRFDGSRLMSRELMLELPVGAQVTSANLELDASFGDQRHGLVGAEFESLHDLPAKGATIGAGRWAIQGVIMEQAMEVSGIALGLMPLERETELYVALRDDVDGSPTGREIGAGSLVLGAVPGRVWIMLWLPAPVLLSAGLHWVSVQAANGRVLWLTGPAGAAPLQLFRQMDGCASRCLAAFDDRGARILLQPRTGRAMAGAGPVGLSLADYPIAASEQPRGQSRDTLVFDLAADLATFSLQAIPSLAMEVASIPLQLSSALAGQVTVYPPRIEYQLAP
jgi:hypothetical protein